MTPKQKELLKKHGSPSAFAKAVYAALGEISINEANVAILKYQREWEVAGKNKSCPRHLRFAARH